jgi:hypothetical protein
MYGDHKRASCTVRVKFAIGGIAALCVPFALNAANGSAAVHRAAVETPAGAAKPVPGSGMGTLAALDDARCNTGAQYSVYGRWDTSSVGAGPFCVRPFADGEDNGGATATGVTADAVKVVILLPSPARSQAQEAAAPARRRGDNSVGTWSDLAHDYLYAHLPFYETWGRNIEVVFYESTGDDEAAQRADAVAIRAERPFAVMSFDTFGLDTLMLELARAKIVVQGCGTSLRETLAVAPYWWGCNSDPDAAAVNSAEVIGKQLAGKKARYAGTEELQGAHRKFGLVMIKDLVDQALFEQTLAKYGGADVDMATESTYVASGGALGDAEQAQRDAPSIVSRMKTKGVSTVVLFTDVAMNRALMEQASAQEWYPEWFMTGAGFFDLAAFAAGYPEDQSAHAFGISLIPPYLDAPPAIADITGTTGAFNWFWGDSVGTNSGVAIGLSNWLLPGIHHAGPNLTPKTFKQGLWAMPATGGSADNDPLNPLVGYGHTTGLPYPSYIWGPADFAPLWMDPHTRGISQGLNVEVDHVSWYLDGGRRYAAGQWPKKLPWFKKSGALFQFDEYPVDPPPTASASCGTGRCPSTGAAQPTPGTPSASGFVADASLAVGPTS